MVFVPESKNRGDFSKLYYIYDYKPYWIYDDFGSKRRNPDFDSDSGLVLDLKDKKDKGVDCFFDKLDSCVNNSVPIAIVPSHDPSKRSTGIKKVAKKLADNGRIDATSCLKRTRKIEKLANGGSRAIEVHLDSIVVVNSHLIEGKDVLLLDDVTTSGNSLAACEQLLIEAGANRVQLYAFAKKA
ncbi:ComF family protein [Gimesia sp.]|uniref:ComF family protein n=1 Tax=Gimesia sp. TaxID=2024833 RepID=UPI003A90C5B0